jgi:hypothetical protein
LEEGEKGTYKPGPLVRFLATRMEQSEKTLLDSISKLMEKLQSMQNKVDKFSGELGAVWTKVDLVMMSISLVQQRASTSCEVHQGGFEFFSSIGGCRGHGCSPIIEGIQLFEWHTSTCTAATPTTTSFFVVAVPIGEFDQFPNHGCISFCP